MHVHASSNCMRVHISLSLSCVILGFFVTVFFFFSLVTLWLLKDALSSFNYKRHFYSLKYLLIMTLLCQHT